MIINYFTLQLTIISSYFIKRKAKYLTVKLDINSEKKKPEIFNLFLRELHFDRVTSATTNMGGRGRGVLNQRRPVFRSMSLKKKPTHQPLPISTPCVPTYTRGHISARCLVDIPTAVVLCTDVATPQISLPLFTLLSCK